MVYAELISINVMCILTKHFTDLGLALGKPDIPTRRLDRQEMADCRRIGPARKAAIPAVISYRLYYKVTNYISKLPTLLSCDISTQSLKSYKR